MELGLSAHESRVLGCLLEKELATPQYYPLTLNSLVLACNQSSNRDPVVQYSESDVGGAITELREKTLARIVHSSGQRADKYRHAVDTRWGLDEQHRAILAVLLLRGAQTAGELRTRTDRLATFDSLTEVEEVLGLLARREEPLVQRLERAPGQKEARWVELLSDAPHTTGSAIADPQPARPATASPTMSPTVPPAGMASEIERLRAEVAELRELVELLLESTRPDSTLG
jgi:uncharacterized protein YceH (UPF0502 family)